MFLIERVMPSYDRRESHHRRVSAHPEAIWEAVRELRAEEMAFTRLLMGLRTLGRDRAGGSRRVLEGFERMGFRVLDEDPGRELVIAGIGRFWQPSGGLRAVEGAAQFAAFDEPGYAKTAFNFRLEDGVLWTETRISCTDDHARRRFGLYWLAIRPGSGLIRREWLRAIDRRAQAAR
ncbi:MAG TPA: hypothetical protein VG518_02045 [Solirubrobacterales bacterium]|nr:hypothetical protein [Solirubrobacterales bacterium]